MKKILLLLSISSLTACTSIGSLWDSDNKPVKTLEIKTAPIDKPKLVLPKVSKLQLRDVEWVVITKDNFDSVLEEAKKTGRPVAFFALTDEGYSNLGLNISDIRAMIQQQQAIIAAYEGYYQQSEKALDEAVKVTK
jgi:hypothetical protein